VSATAPSPSLARLRSPDLWHPLLRGASLVAIGLALGLAVVRAHGEAVPVALVGPIAGAGVIWALFRGPERRFLLTLFLVAFALRTVLAVAADPYMVSVQVTKEGELRDRCVGCLFQDDRAYDKTAWALARTWAGTIPGVAESDEYLLKTYTYMVGGLYYFLGHELMTAKFLNCFIGAITVVPMYALGRELGGGKAGRMVALAGAFWPSLILWSVINLKDVLVVLLIAAILFLALRFARKPSLIVAAFMLVTFAGLQDLRLYVFYAFGWLVPMYFFLVNRSPWRRRLAIGVPLWAGILVVMVLMNQGTQWLGLRYLTDKRVEALDGSRRFGSDTAESGIDLADRIDRAEGGWAVQIRNLPIVMPYVLWAPFPWAARRASDLAIVPEMVAWYAVQLLALIAVIARGRQHWRELFLPIVFSGGLVFVFSLIEGNVGTIYRHRAMLMPPLFAIAAVGLLVVREWWARRRGMESHRKLAGAVPHSGTSSA
jgi:hypothetical protein